MTLYPTLALAATQETRKIFGGETGTAQAVFYVLSLITIVIFFTGIVLRLRKYYQGRPAVEGRWRRPPQPADVPEVTQKPGIAKSFWLVATNRTIGRDKAAVGGAHLMVFWGFLGLFAATTILSLDYDILRNVTYFLFGHEDSFFYGTFYKAYNAVFNLAGVIAILGTAHLMGRRASHKEPQLDYTRAHKPEEGYSRKQFASGDWLFMGLLMALFVTGFLIQGLRIDSSNFPAFEKWTWMGYVLALAFNGVGIGATTASHIHAWLWWLHIALAFGFVAYIPFSKAMHIITSPANLVAKDPANTRRVPAPPEGQAGYLQLADFTPKELLGFDACTKCGRCHSVCPARTVGAPLSPRDLILDLRQWVDGQKHIPAVWDHEERPTQSGPLAASGEGGIAGNVIAQRTLWSCTTCMACVEICPVGIEHVPTIIQLRRNLVDAGDMDPSLQTALQNIAQQGNSFGKSARMRARWTKGLEFTVPDARKEPVEFLWFVGDFASFDERLQGLSRTLATIFHDAGISFGILYEDERNAGNDVRRVGEEGLFEMLVEQNMAALAKADFQTVITTDPHTFNTMRNEYPSYGFDKPVRHYSEVLTDLVLSGRIPVKAIERTVTYHDPCYLGRYNRVLDAPRALIEALGCKLVEMPRNGLGSFCCGAGGGRIWMDDSYLDERPSENRMKEAVTLGVDTFVVACPKDFAMFSDAVKTTGQEGKMVVTDIVQLLDAALDRDRMPAMHGAETEQ